MGRKLMKVPDNWNHPTEMRLVYCSGSFSRKEVKLVFQPLFDEEFAEVVAEYEENKRRWDAGDRPKYYEKGESFEDHYGKPPEAADYRPWTNLQAKKFTWWQVWETVSEGTPVTPAFATKEELVEYLVEHGDYWDQVRRQESENNPRGFQMQCDPWSREAAMNFVFGTGWAPSLVANESGVKRGIDFVGEKSSE